VGDRRKGTPLIRPWIFLLSYTLKINCIEHLASHGPFVCVMMICLPPLIATSSRWFGEIILFVWYWTKLVGVYSLCLFFFALRISGLYFAVCNNLIKSVSLFCLTVCHVFMSVLVIVSNCFVIILFYMGWLYCSQRAWLFFSAYPFSTILKCILVYVYVFSGASKREITFFERRTSGYSVRLYVEWLIVRCVDV